MMSKTLGIVFSNMHDSMLGQLTENRTMASVPFGGRYRLIDFVLSNLINSGIKDVGIITKSNFQSLMDHVGNGKEWDLSRKKGGLTILPPYGSQEAVLYRGRLEALGNIYNYIRSSKAEIVVMTDCDNITSIDYSDVLRYHKEKDADITVVYKHKPITDSIHRDVITISMDENKRVNGAFINPEQEEGNVLLNMTVISKRLLERIISEASSTNFYSFTRGVLQQGNQRLKIYGYAYDNYVADIKSLQSYYDCTMELLNPDVRRQLFPPERPVYTKVRDEVPVRYGINASAKNSMIADGCIIEGTVENSVIFRGVKIDKGAVVKNSILMQGTYVGEKSVLDCVVTDKDVMIRDSKTLIGCKEYPFFIKRVPQYKMKDAGSPSLSSKEGTSLFKIKRI